MYNTREKLIEILRVPIYPHLDADPAEVVADYLLDNGVTFATDNNVGDKLTPTNADRIRAMSDEELAEYLAEIGNDVSNGIEYSERPDDWLEWLKQPAEAE